MTTRQHIYSGKGHPHDALPELHDVAGHHYSDELTGDVYIGSTRDKWVKVSDYEEQMKIYLDVPTEPLTTPDGPALWFAASTGEVYLAVSIWTAGPDSRVWEWKKLSLTDL